MKLDDRKEQAALAAAAAAPAAADARGRVRLRLGDLLVAQHVLTPVQLKAALDEQRASGRKLGRILIEDGITDEPTIARALAQQMKLTYVELTLDQVQPAVAKKLPPAQAQRLRVLPIADDGRLLRVAMADPTDYQAFDEAQRLLGRDIDVVVVTETRLKAVLDRLASNSEELTGLAREIQEQVGAPVVDTAQLSAGAAPEEAPVARLLQKLFEDAVRARASDIHIEPQDGRLAIRLRVDGALTLYTEADGGIAQAVVQRLKLIAGLDIAERRLPQDGRFVARVKDHHIDLRISTMPTQHGETAVLRLLPTHMGILALDKLGMPAGILERVQGFTQEPHGMMLVTGPTGSGKTTTLYAVLAAMNTPENKIVTVEDPVEYRLAGASQVQVNEKIGLTFATVLRSTLRQDPDIVLVGEMRDRDTAEIGLRAAMTGHMVLSTLHTRDAASTPIRLHDMGAAMFLIATSLRLVLAQRLVRTVCPRCAEPYRATPVEHAFLHAHLRAAADIALGADSPLRAGRGCAHCSHSGYVGRHGVYELLEVTPPMAQLLAAGDTTAYLTAAQREVGVHSLAHHACALALSGVTSVREALRTVGRGQMGHGAH
jgi:MSHA biogenesis protein MshE